MCSFEIAKEVKGEPADAGALNWIGQIDRAQALTATMRREGLAAWEIGLEGLRVERGAQLHHAGHGSGRHRQ